LLANTIGMFLRVIVSGRLIAQVTATLPNGLARID
jgi:hypothetical protein